MKCESYDVYMKVLEWRQYKRKIKKNVGKIKSSTSLQVANESMNYKMQGTKDAIMYHHKFSLFVENMV